MTHSKGKGERAMAMLIPNYPEELKVIEQQMRQTKNVAEEEWWREIRASTRFHRDIDPWFKQKQHQRKQTKRQHKAAKTKLYMRNMEQLNPKLHRAKQRASFPDMSLSEFCQLDRVRIKLFSKHEFVVDIRKQRQANKAKRAAISCSDARHYRWLADLYAEAQNVRTMQNMVIAKRKNPYEALHYQPGFIANKHRFLS